MPGRFGLVAVVFAGRGSGFDICRSASITLRKDELLEGTQQGAKIPSSDGNFTEDGPMKIQTPSSRLQRNTKSQIPKLQKTPNSKSQELWRQRRFNVLTLQRDLFGIHPI